MPADQFRYPQSILRVIKTTNQLLIEMLFSLTMFKQFTSGVRLVTRLLTCMRHPYLRRTCRNLTVTYHSHELISFALKTDFTLIAMNQSVCCVSFSLSKCQLKSLS